MNGKLIKLSKIKKKSPKKEIIEKLRSNYPRMKRDYEASKIESPEKIEKLEEMYIGAIGDHLQTWILSKTLEDEGFTSIVDLDLGEAGLPVYMDHIFYKALKQVYGMPDPIVFGVEHKGLGITIEGISGEFVEEELDVTPDVWSYVLELEEGYYIEVYRKDIVYPNFKLWVSPEIDAERHKTSLNALLDKVMAFLSLLYELLYIVDKNYSIKDEQELPSDERRKPRWRMVTNLYSQYLQAANDIIEIAEELSTKKQNTAQGILHFPSKGDIKKTMRNEGSLYISATIFCIMALEGFINMLYDFLLKPEFKYEQYERSIRENCLELKIFHLPVYCKGFSNAHITPEDDAIKNWQSIRYFRNNLIHANLTPEHEQFLALEDGVYFYYRKLMHKKFSEKFKNHSDPRLFNKDIAIRVKRTIEEIVVNIVDKMDKNEKEWIKTWIDQANIMDR